MTGPYAGAAYRREAGRSAERRAGTGTRGQARSATESSPAPLRLTRRGRLVLGAAVLLVSTAAAMVISFAASGGAQASNHGQPRAGYQGMHQVVVEPGQTMWSIAARAEPSADPRLVIQEIMTANALTGQQLQAGQLLWIPN